ncbi:MAG TPA: CbtA family protein, partial [Stellaceae bacterium]|nr:CbtA family protein [Stellaceae bacterium]
MAALRRLLYAGLCAGLLCGVLVAAAQHVGTVPLILKAEIYEQAAQPPAATHLHATEWAPEDGVERTAYTLAADLLAAIGFALLLAAGLALRGGEAGWREGLLWGLAGFAAFTLAP